MPARPRTPEDEEGLIIPWSPSPSPSPDRTPAKLEKKGRRPRESVESSVTLLADQSYLKPQSGPAPPVAHTSSTEGDEKRLKLIEEALDEPAPPSRPARGTKRASDTSLHDGNVQLPHAPLVGEPKPKKSRRTNPFAQQQQGSPPVPAALPVPRPTPARREPLINIRHQVKLSDEQQHVLRLVLEGRSVFFTGSAGTGKSVLLREIIRSLREKYQNETDSVAITASTGIAACNVGGITLHSFAGIGLGTSAFEELLKQVRRNPKAVQRWTRTKVLIVDEISMVEGGLFDKIVLIARSVRKNPNGMGGLQLVVTGDFFQLPPVVKPPAPMIFSFEATTWPAVIERTFNLTKVFRQKDQTFVNMLNETRFGALSSNSIERFRSLARSIDRGDGIEPTELFPLRGEVDTANDRRLRALPGETVCFVATDGGLLLNGTQSEKTFSKFVAPSELSLKVNCQVMLIKNTDETLVNGSMGKVIAFRTSAEHDAIVAGMSIDERSDVGNNKAAWKYPVVRFSVFDAMHNRTTYRDVLVQRESWKVEGTKGEVLASRTQIPLILAWAMSIHKSQGQTLDRVRVDLGRVFEKGQAYVALSRATSLEGLQVLSFDPDRVMAHPRVIEWSATLETVPERERQ